MIYDQTKLALQALFPPETTPAPPPEPPEETGDAKKPAKPSKPVARSCGLVERDYAVHGYHLDAQVEPDQLLAAVSILDQSAFFLETITGVDWLAEGQLEVIYDFSRYDFELCRVVIRTRIPRQSPVLPTITTIIAGANWHERETHDFFGIVFDGHPHLIPLLLPEDADFHPLLKDFKA